MGESPPRKQQNETRSSILITFWVDYVKIGESMLSVDTNPSYSAIHRNLYQLRTDPRCDYIRIDRLGIIFSQRVWETEIYVIKHGYGSLKQWSANLSIMMLKMKKFREMMHKLICMYVACITFIRLRCEKTLHMTRPKRLLCRRTASASGMGSRLTYAMFRECVHVSACTN